MRAIPAWDHHPLWREPADRGLSAAHRGDRRPAAPGLRSARRNTGCWRRWGFVPSWSCRWCPAGQIAGIITFAYTEESGRRYGRDDPPLAEELALHAAHAFENARLMKNLRRARRAFASRSPAPGPPSTSRTRRCATSGTTTRSCPANVLGKTHEEAFPADEAAPLTRRSGASSRRASAWTRRWTARSAATNADTSARRWRRCATTRARSSASSAPSTDITEQQRTQQQLTRGDRFPRADDGHPRPRSAQPARHDHDGGRPAAAPRRRARRRRAITCCASAAPPAA